MLSRRGSRPNGWITPDAVLLRDGVELCPLVVAETPRTRLRGLLRTDDVDGALLLRPSSSVHTLGMRYDLDVAHLDGDLVVLRVTTMPRRRVGAPVRRCRAVLETRAGVMGGWGLRVGDRLEVRREQ